MMPGSARKTRSKGFTLVEIMISLAILGILAAISIPNFRMYKDRAECASMMTTLKYLMDGEDFHFLENGSFHPQSGTLNIPKKTAVEIPELAYNFSEGNRNRYRIRSSSNKWRDYYQITVFCDFDSNGNGKKDRFKATTDIRKRTGVVKKNREIVQLR
jgi:prepilin-type N-terminal cleavage/methylation domain-containing protein